MLDCRTGQHQAHPWSVGDTYLDGVFDGFAVACPMGKNILVSTIFKSLSRLHPLPCSDLSQVFTLREELAFLWYDLALLDVSSLKYACYRCLFIIHFQAFVVLHIYIPWRNTIRIHTVRYYLDCRHNRHRHSPVICKPPPPPTAMEGRTTS